MSVISSSVWRSDLAEVRQRDTQAPLRRLRSLMLLSGSVRTTPFLAAIQRAVLDLPVERGLTLLDLWCRHVQDLARAIDWRFPQVCVLTTRNGCSSGPAQRRGEVMVTFEPDRDELRGTAGVLRDASESFDPDDQIIVAHAAKILRIPLTNLARQLAGKGGDVTLVSHVDGQPSSLSLIRCGCLRSVARVGYVDLKEQALPRLAMDHTVSVLRKHEAIGMPIRTMAEYLEALRWYQTGQNTALDDGQPSFAIIESGADVQRGVQIVDSVVLRGARVESGAIVARSVVCPGELVRRDSVVIDQLITASSRT